MDEGRKKRCVIYANCQGAGIRDILSMSSGFASSYDAIHISNFGMIQNKKPLSPEIFRGSGCLIYQPLGKKYGVYSSESILGLLSSKCEVISFPYIYNDALWPFAPSGSGLKGGEVLKKLRSSGYSVKQVINLFVNLEVDCEFDRRFRRSVGILREKEKSTDLKVSDFIQDNVCRKRLFLTQSHPANIVYTHCVNQILEMLGFKCLDSSDCFSKDDSKWPTTPYEIDFYKFNFIDKAEPGWEMFYSDKIESFLNIG